jgi:hypothetical protein
LALAMPNHKCRFAPERLQFLASSTFRRAELFESDRPPDFSRVYAPQLRFAPTRPNPEPRGPNP